MKKDQEEGKPQEVAKTMISPHNDLMDTIYLDHNATSPTRPEVIETVARAYAEGYANPASQHRLGQTARKVLEDARERISSVLGADLTSSSPDRLIFTSGGTESNNLALLGIAQARSQTPGKIVISAIEHQSVIEPAEYLLEQGWRLDTLPVTSEGVVCVDSMSTILTQGTQFASVTLGNHETGVLQPIPQIAQFCNDRQIPFHTDAAQVVGKLPVDFRGLGVSALSFAAHKFGGPLGIGGLLLRPNVAVRPLMFGGHQQFGLRPGTESVPLVLGMVTALELWQKEQDESIGRLDRLRERFENGLRAGRSNILVHGEKAERIPQTSNIAFPGLDGQILLIALDLAGISCSIGSACSSGSTELSPTLRAMGLSTDIVGSSLRFSLGRTTTEAEIDEAVRRILQVCREMD